MGEHKTRSGGGFRMLFGRSRVVHFMEASDGRLKTSDFIQLVTGNQSHSAFSKEVELMAAEMSFQCESKKKPGA